MIGEILGAGVSLLGGLFGKKKQQTTTRINYGQMVKDAEAAGFNPLTAIRNGGSAGFTTTSSPTISNTPEILGNLGGILGQAFGDKLDPINAKKREIDTLLVDRQLRQLKEGPQVVGSLRQPRTYTGTKVSQQLVPRVGVASHKSVASVPAAYKPLNSNLNGVDDPTASNLGLDNKRYGLFNPGWLPDAGKVLSDVMGEPGEWIGGLAKMPEIGAYSLYRNLRSMQDDVAPWVDRKIAEGKRLARPKAYQGYKPRLPGGWIGGALKRHVNR